jgi:hypothetical protein
MVTSSHRVDVDVGADGTASAPLRGRRRYAAGGRCSMSFSDMRNLPLTNHDGRTTTSLVPI